MATIPQYQRRVSKTNNLSAPRQSASAPRSAFGSSGEELQQVSSVFGKLSNFMTERAEEQRRDRNSAWVSESMSKLTADYDGYTIGTEDGRVVGAYSRVGKDADGLTKKSSKDLQKYIDTYSKDAPDQDAADLFKQNALRLKSSTQRGIARHQANELKKWGIQSKQSNVVAQKQRIFNNYTLTAGEIEENYENFVKPDLEELSQITGTPLVDLERVNKSELYTKVIHRHINDGNIDQSLELIKRWEKGIDSEASMKLKKAAKGKKTKERVGSIQLALAEGKHSKANQMLKKWAEDIPDGTEARMVRAVQSKNVKMTSDTEAQNYFGKYVSGELKTNDVYSEIDEIEDVDMRDATRRRFSMRVSQWKNEQKTVNEDFLVKSLLELDNLEGDLDAQFHYVDDLPNETKDQRKIKKQLESRYRLYAAAKGKKLKTDPSAYDDLLEAIDKAEVRTSVELRAHKAALGVEEQDIKDLERSLDDAQKYTDKQLKTAYSFSVGKGGSFHVTKRQKKDRGAFMAWARKMAMESNRAEDPEYLKKLADSWVLQEGERQGGFAIGYGENMTLGQAIKEGAADTWLPDTPDKDRVAEIERIFSENPEVQRAWMVKYEDDKDLAIRAYQKELMLKEFGPVR